MSPRRFLLHRPWLICVFVLSLPFLTGYVWLSGPKTDYLTGNLPTRTGTSISSGHVHVTADLWTHSRFYSSDTNFEYKVNSRDASTVQTPIDSASKVATDTLAVESFYTMLKLCISSRECPGD